MRILALNPPFLPKFSRESRSPAVAKSGTLYYPMWLAYAVGCCEQQGDEALFIDAPAKDISLDVVIAQAQQFAPRLAIIETSTPSIYNDISVAEKLKEAIPGLFTILVGVHPSALPEETLTGNRVDAAAYGEYDETIAEVSRVVAAGVTDTSLASIKGIAWRAHDGKIIRNERRPYLEDLDKLPMVSQVYKRHLDIEPYFYGHSRSPIVVLVTGRGCPFHCTYCVIPQTLMGHAYRKRSIESVVAEFVFIRDNMPGVQEIMIEDDTLTADKNRCRAFSQALIDAKATTIPWSANSRADVDYETMRLMKKAGCRLFCVGFESGDQQVLDNIKKGTNLERIGQFVKEAKRAGILLHGCFMVGNRGETHATLDKTLAMALKLSPDTAQFFPIMVYPGTSDFAYYEEKGWITTKDYRQWLTEEGLHSSVVSNPDLTYQELVAFCDKARQKFYLRPQYLLAKLLQAAKNPSEAGRLIKGGKALFRYIFKPALKAPKSSA